MRHSLILITCLTLGSLLFSIEPPEGIEVIDWEEENGLLFDNGKAYEFTSEFSPKGRGIKDVTKKIEFFQRDDYWFYRYENQETFVIPGDDLLQIFRKPSENSLKEHYSVYYGLRGTPSETAQPPSDINIRTIKTKTFLSENIFGRKIDYQTTWLMRKFIKACSCHQFIYDDLVPPWVEAEADFGSTEEIKVIFKRPTDGIVILNGYVDIYRPYLFQQNNRLQEILISAKEFSTNFTFKDSPRFTTIKLPKKTSQITISILSVYPGTKYNDTAISAILGFIPKKVRKGPIKKQYKLR